MRGVITMNEEYETRFLCNSAKVRGWGRAVRAWGGGEGVLQVTVSGRQVPRLFCLLRRRFWYSSLNGCG